MTAAVEDGDATAEVLANNHEQAGWHSFSDDGRRACTFVEIDAEDRIVISILKG